MDFDLTEEQRLLAASVDRFGRDHYDAAAWRALTAPNAACDRTNWRRMAELGWLAMALPEDLGGYGGTPVDVMVLMEGIGRFLMLEPFVSTTVLSAALLGASAGSLAAEIAGGRTVVATAVAEPQGRYDLSWVETRAERNEAGYRLTGTKSHVPDGGGADVFIVPARLSGAVDEPGGVALFLVSADAAGLAVSRTRAIDHSRNCALVLNDVEVDADALLVGEAQGLVRLAEAVDRAIAARLAEALGCMEALAAMTLSHLRTRKQFGVAIGTFQVLQHKMVDIAIACEEARSLVYAATLSLEGEPRQRQIMISAAKARVGQLSLTAARASVQLHGGVGASEELMVGHYLKRLMMIDQSFGASAHHLMRFAALSDAA